MTRGRGDPAFFINRSMHWTDLEQITPPTSPVLTVEDVKKHLAIAHSDEDDYLATLIEVATAYIDGPSGVGIALRPQTWKLWADDWRPRQKLQIPLGPLRQIAEVIADGVVVDPDHYIVRGDRLRILNPRTIRDLTVEFTAGYETVPADLLHAIRLIVGHLYANREATTEAALSTVPLAVDAILGRYRVAA